MTVFLDYASTTPFDSEIFEQVTQTVNDFGNPSSTHKVGKKAKATLEEARNKMASAIHAHPSEIIITSGATEANNLAIKGTVARFKRPHIITTTVEHSSVKSTYELLEDSCEVSYISVGKDGHIDLEELRNAIQENTVLLSVILVNNETGVIQNVREIKKVLEGTDIRLHLDAVQSFGHIDIDVTKLGVDFLSLSAHKIYGPKGIGLLYCKNGCELSPIITGGAHESGRRAGTENNLWVYALALAMEKALAHKVERVERLREIKSSFINALKEAGIPFEINGDVESSSHHILNVYFPWVDVQVMLTALDMKDVYISGGSACNSGSVKPSHVITAMYDKERANHSFRFSFSHIMKDSDLQDAVAVIASIYDRLLLNA